jgi:hypothetical protein
MDKLQKNDFTYSNAPPSGNFRLRPENSINSLRVRSWNQNMERKKEKKKGRKYRDIWLELLFSQKGHHSDSYYVVSLLHSKGDADASTLFDWFVHSTDYYGTIQL